MNVFITEESNYYFRFPQTLEGRLDFVFYHPELDVIEHLSDLTYFDVITIGDLVNQPNDLTSGSTPAGISYVEDGILFLGATNVQDGKLDLSTTVRIPETYHNFQLRSSQLHKGDVLMSMAGHYIGKCCIYDAEEDANINQALARLRVNQDVIIPEFLVKYLNSRFGQLGFRKYRHDVGQPNINLEEIKLIKVIKPKVETQRTILHSIEPLEKEAEELEQQAGVAYDQANALLLENLGIDFTVKKRYFFKSGREGESLVFYAFPNELSNRLHYLFYHPYYSALEKINTKYKTILLKEASSRPVWRGEQPDYDENGEILVFKTVDIKHGFIDYERALRISREFYERNPNAQIQKGDILLSSTGYMSMGKVAVYDRNKPALVDGHISVIRLNNNYDPYFMAYFLLSHLGQLQIEKWWTGSSGQIELPQADVEKFVVISHESLPREMQEHIARRITAKLSGAQELESNARAKRDEANQIFEQFILGQIKL